MSRSSQVLLANTAEFMNLSGTPVRSGGWYGYGDCLHTVQIVVSNFKGKVHIEASVALEPTEDDWFDAVPVVSFPRDSGNTGESVTIGSTFRGNFVWIRARMDREGYINPVPPQTPQSLYGAVDRVLLDYTSKVWNNSSGGGSDVNGVNVGTGADVFKEKNIDGDLVFKTLKASGLLTITESADEVTLTVGGGQTTTINIKQDGTSIGTANTLDFGDGFDVAVSNGAAVVSVDAAALAAASTEFVEFRYSAGNNGNLNVSDAIVGNSTNVTATIVDAVNSIVRFDFVGYPNPPVAVSTYGQSYATNEFNFQNVGPSFATRKVSGGGTASAPTLIGDFERFTLQLRMQDTGASAGFGERARAIVMFKF